MSFTTNAWIPQFKFDFLYMLFCWYLGACAHSWREKICHQIEFESIKAALCSWKWKLKVNDGEISTLASANPNIRTTHLSSSTNARACSLHITGRATLSRCLVLGMWMMIKAEKSRQWQIHEQWERKSRGKKVINYLSILKMKNEISVLLYFFFSLLYFISPLSTICSLLPFTRLCAARLDAFSLLNIICNLLAWHCWLNGIYQFSIGFFLFLRLDSAAGSTGERSSHEWVCVVRPLSLRAMDKFTIGRRAARLIIPSRTMLRFSSPFPPFVFYFVNYRKKNTDSETK